MQRMRSLSHPPHIILEAIGQFRFLVPFLPPAHGASQFAFVCSREHAPRLEVLRTFMVSLFNCMQCWEPGWNLSILGLSWDFIVVIVVAYFFLFFLSIFDQLLGGELRRRPNSGHSFSVFSCTVSILQLPILRIIILILDSPAFTVLQYQSHRSASCLSCYKLPSLPLVARGASLPCLRLFRSPSLSLTTTDPSILSHGHPKRSVQEGRHRGQAVDVEAEQRRPSRDLRCARTVIQFCT